MNNREKNFKEALKTLVGSEPEKLAFFDGSGKASIPPFVPEAKTEDLRKPAYVKRQRRGYMFGMVAAAACCIVFASAAIINYGPGSLDTAVSGDYSAATAAPEAPAAPAAVEPEGEFNESSMMGAGEADETYGIGDTAGSADDFIIADNDAGDEIIVTDSDVGTSGANAFPLLIIGTIIFAAVFLLLYVKRRKASGIATLM